MTLVRKFGSRNGGRAEQQGAAHLATRDDNSFHSLEFVTGLQFRDAGWARNCQLIGQIVVVPIWKLKFAWKGRGRWIGRTVPDGEQIRDTPIPSSGSPFDE
jgi:hypothetical protein